MKQCYKKLLQANKALILFLIICSITSVSFGAKYFYVAPNGDENGRGSFEKPFSSVCQAQKVVRQHIAAGLKEDIYVLIREGTYELKQPLVFNAADSGTDEYKVVYQAYGDDKPIISGGRSIINWQLNDDGTWSTKIDTVVLGKWNFRELYVDGKRAVRARHPNKDFYRVVKAGPDNRTSFYFNPGEFTQCSKPTEAEVVLLQEWWMNRIAVKDIDFQDSKITTVSEVGSLALKDFTVIASPHEKHARYFLENSRSFLDSPGEWYLDRNTGLLTYYPKPDEQIGVTKITAPFVKSLLKVKGTIQPYKPVKNLHFIGLHFKHCSYPLPVGGYIGVQACFYEIRPVEKQEKGVIWEPVSAALTFEAVQNCSFQDGSVKSTGGSGLWFSKACHGNKISGNIFEDIGAVAVLLGEGNERHVDEKVWYKTVPEQAASANLIENNIIQQCGKVFYGAVGIWAGFVNKTRIRHNVVHDMPYSGISVGWKWGNEMTVCAENHIESNHVYNVMNLLSDGGAIYVLGKQPGSTIIGNLVHDVSSTHGRSPNEAIRFDNGGSDFRVEQNAIYNVPDPIFWFNPNTGNVLVVNNYIALPAEDRPFEKLPAFRDRWNQLKMFNHKPERKSSDDIVFKDNVVVRGKKGLAKVKNEIALAQKHAGLQPKYRSHLGM